MTDNDIIKALEDIIKHLDFTQIKSGENVLVNALDLINRQKAENSNLTSYLTSLQNDLTSAKAEIERLQETICMITKTGRFYSTVRAEAIKEFEEELWFNVFNDSELNTESYVRLTKHIDDTKKEMVGDV